MQFITDAKAKLAQAHTVLHSPAFAAAMKTVAAKYGASLTPAALLQFIVANLPAIEAAIADVPKLIALIESILHPTPTPAA